MVGSDTSKEWFMKSRLMGIVVVTCLLTACSSVTKPRSGRTAGNQMQKTMEQSVKGNQKLAQQGNKQTPNSVNQSLVPQMNVQNPNKEQDSKDKHFNVEVSNVDAKQFFRGLVKNTPLNIVVDPKVEGSITLHLKNVTIPDVLQAVHNNYGYEYKKTHYGYQIKPRQIETRVFQLNYLNVERSGKSSTSVESGQVSRKVSGGDSEGGSSTSSEEEKAGSEVDTTSESHFWKEIKQTLTMIIGDKDGHKVITNPNSGTLIVKAYPNELDEVSHYIDQIQKDITRQVIINAKVLEIQLSNQYQAGVNWSAFGGKIEQTAVDTSSNPLFGNVLKLSGHWGGDDLKGAIHLLSKQGNVQVLSSPRVSTLNNQKAVIKVGNDEFFVTDVSTTTRGGNDNLQQTSDVDLTPFFSGIALDVTPQINKDGDIILHIHPVVSEVSDNNKEFTVNGKKQSLPLAKSKVRESDSIVRAQNGQVVIIGGLMENDTEEQNKGVPFLSKAPGAGPLFRKTNQEGQKEELIILLKPTVVSNKTLNDTLKKDAKQVKQMNKGFHFGSHPEVFGNKGEPTVQYLNKNKGHDKKHAAPKQHTRSH